MENIGLGISAAGTLLALCLTLRPCLFGGRPSVYTSSDKKSGRNGDPLSGKNVVQTCTLLVHKYTPPLLWGWSGIAQTLLFATKGRFGNSCPVGGKRLELQLLQDGSISTVDIFEPIDCHPSTPTVLLIPGYVNGVSNQYVKTSTHFLQQNGFRVVVLSHLGCVPDVGIVAPRIFSIGDTEEVLQVLSWTIDNFPVARLSVLGFSAGANLVLKALGQNSALVPRVNCILSFCQAYDLQQAKRHFTAGLGWLWNWMFAAKIMGVIRKQIDVLKRVPGVNSKRLLQQRFMEGVDRELHMRVHGFEQGFDGDHERFLTQSSCRQFIKNLRSVPLLLVNTKDDPLVPRFLVQPVIDIVRELPRAILAYVPAGGHLGFFEPKWWCPFLAQESSWMDRLIVQYLNVVLQAESGRSDSED